MIHIRKDIAKKPNKVSYKSDYLCNGPYYAALQKFDKTELIQLLMDFKENVVEEIQAEEVINYSARKLFIILSVKAKVLRS